MKAMSKYLLELPANICLINNLTKINKFVCDIETDNKVILNRLEDMLKKNNSLKFKNMNACERCGEIFSNKRLLTKHVKTCGENIIH
jgi:hypothetical protein